MPFYQGRVVKLCPGHYKIVHLNTRTGVVAVPELQRDPDRCYCTCGKPLNKNNRTGMCIHCVNAMPRKLWPKPKQLVGD